MHSIDNLPNPGDVLCQNLSHLLCVKTTHFTVEQDRAPLYGNGHVLHVAVAAVECIDDTVHDFFVHFEIPAILNLIHHSWRLPPVHDEMANPMPR